MAPPTRGSAPAARIDWTYAAAFTACAVAALVPIWSARWLPIVDLPQHVALVSIWKHLADPAWGFAGTYALRLGSPYALGPVLLRGLCELADPVTAAHLWVSLFVVALPLSTDVLLRAAGADRWWSLAAFPAVFGFSFHWGFLPFLVAVPPALLLVAASFRYARDPTRRAAGWLAIGSLLLYPTHAVVLPFALSAAALVIAGHAPSWRSAAVRALPLLAPLPAAAAWTAWTRSTAATGDVWAWSLSPRRFDELPGMLFGAPPESLQDLPLTYDLLAIGVLTGVVALAVVAAPRVRRGLAYAGPVAVALLAYFLAPDVAFGSSFLYQRAPVFLVPFAALMLGAPTSALRGRIARAGLVAIVLGAMAVWAGRYRAFEREAGGFDTVLARMEPGRKVLGLSFRSLSPTIPGAPFFLHYAGWYQATRGGVLGYSFAGEYAQLVRYLPGAEPQMTPGLNFMPGRFRWEVDGGYDYFLVRAFEDAGPFLSRGAPAPVELVVRDGPWWLYRSRAGGPNAAAAAVGTGPR